MQKVKFDLSSINDIGLTGPPGGLRSVSFEFCIPLTENALAEVLSIDSSIQHHLSSRGRIQCSESQQLCIAETYNEQRGAWAWKEILRQLADLSFIDCFELSLGE